MTRRRLATFVAAVALLGIAACGDALEAEDDAASASPRAAAELLDEVAALDARITALEERLGELAAAASAADLRELDAQILGLVARVRYLEASAALPDLDPLFCVSMSSPAYGQAEFDVYFRGIPICGILPP